MKKILTEEQTRNLFYAKLTQALHEAVAECIEHNGMCVHLIHVLGQFKRFEEVIEKTAGFPQQNVTNYPE